MFHLLSILIALAAVFYYYTLISTLDPSVYKFVELPPTLEGVLAQNEVLRKAERHFHNKLIGPESFTHNPQTGTIYTGTADGNIWTINPETKTAEPLIRTGETVPECGSVYQQSKFEPICGRPKGMKYDAVSDLLYVMDCYKGLLSIHVKTKKLTVLVPREPGVDGAPLRFLNSIDIRKNGIVYFTTSTTKWDRHDYRAVVIENANNGRIHSYNPKTKEVKTILDGLYFANGLTFTHDLSSILVVEMTTHRIRKLTLDEQGVVTKNEIFADNLPGYADNIKKTSHGTYYVGITTSRFTKQLPIVGVSIPPLLDLLAPYPSIKKLMFAITPYWMYNYFLPAPAYFLELDNSGKIVGSFHDPTGSNIKHVSEAYEVGDKIYLGSVENPYVGVLNKKDLK